MTDSFTLIFANVHSTSLSELCMSDTHITHSLLLVTDPSQKTRKPFHPIRSAWMTFTKKSDRESTERKVLSSEVPNTDKTSSEHIPKHA